MKRTLCTLAAGFAGLSALEAQTSTAVSDVAGARAAWTSDYEAARARAAKEGKDLLVVFTGSDWIKLCQLYDRDILFQPDFINGIRDRYVPVRLDFPKDVKQSAQEKTRNRLLMRAYRVTAFPTLILSDTEGRPYGINGYQPLTPDEYSKVVQAMGETRVVRDDLLAKAASAEGVEKASLLSKAIPKLPGSLAARYYRPELEEVIAHDPENRTGKVPLCRKLIADVDYSAGMEKLKRDIEWSKMIELTDAYIKEQNLQGAELQNALFNKVGVYRDQANVPDLIRTLLQIVRIDETTATAKRARKILDGMRAEVLEEQLKVR